MNGQTNVEAIPAKLPQIAVVIPYFRSEALIDGLVARLSAALSSIGADWQVVLVDDGSPDEGWAKIAHAASQDSRITGVRLSRNFGQHAAITAGMHHARARWYVVMDCDLQDRPEDIPSLYSHALEKGVDVALAQRESSGLGLRRTFGSRAFNLVLRWMSLTDFSNEIGNFRIFSDKVAEAYRAFPEQMRFFPALMNEVGFSSSKLRLPRDERPAGQSSYNFRKLLRLAFDSVVTYTDRPLRYLAASGAAIAAGSVVLGLAVILRALFFGSPVAGWPSLMAMVAFFGGAQIFAISILGLYVGQVFKETKRRPIYIVDKVTSGGQK